MFALDEIPWDKLAFPTTRVTLENLLRDPDGKEITHSIVNEPPPPDDPID